MRDFVVIALLLCFAVAIVSSERRLVKRQDLIPFPRVGKRDWNREEEPSGPSGREMTSYLEDITLEQSPKRLASEQNILNIPMTYQLDPKARGLDLSSEDQPNLKSLLGRISAAMQHPSGNLDLLTPKSSRKMTRKHLRSSPNGIEMIPLNTLLVKILQEQLKAKTPEEIARFFQTPSKNQRLSLVE
ncbi:hypothetical protein SK128_004797 [Halocaridina rubra]|uniref:Uncharacterized protein n=1 Tax=Halocaridina rubra TaxID=373956 RepID=A0AAN8WPP3_HALRR